MSALWATSTPEWPEPEYATEICMHTGVGGMEKMDIRVGRRERERERERERVLVLQHQPGLGLDEFAHRLVKPSLHVRALSTWTHGSVCACIRDHEHSCTHMSTSAHTQPCVRTHTRPRAQMHTLIYASARAHSWSTPVHAHTLMSTHTCTRQSRLQGGEIKRGDRWGQICTRQSFWFTRQSFCGFYNDTCSVVNSWERFSCSCVSSRICIQKGMEENTFYSKRTHSTFKKE